MGQDKLWMGLIGGLIGLILFAGAIDLVYDEFSQSLIDLFRTLAFVGLLFGPIYAVVQKKNGTNYPRSLLAALLVMGVVIVVLAIAGYKGDSIAVTAVSIGVFALLQSISAYLLDRHTSRT